MISPFAALLVLGCSGGADDAPKPGDRAAPITPPAAPTTPAAMGLERGTGAIVWQALDHLADGRFQFPETSSGVGLDGRFLLDHAWRDEGLRKGGRRAFSTPLPFASNMPRPNYPPMGARLRREGTEIPFATSLSGPSTSPSDIWYVDHGRVMLLTAESPETWRQPGELVVEELAAALRQRQLATSGRTPSEFARTSITDGPISRPGLYLPAPATADFTVPIPATGKLRFGLGMLEDPVTGKPVGDGMNLAVTLDGAEVWSGRVSPDSEPVAIEASLPAGSARSGVLRFVSSPGDSSEGDYLVLTDPYIVDASPARAARRVLVVGIDTLRWDALGANGYARTTSPELDQWLAQSVQFTHAYAPAPRTKPSFRSAFTGRYPNTAGESPTLAEILSPLGFSTGGIVGNVHLVPRFGFNAGMDHWEYENGAKGSEQVDRALLWARAHKDEDSFLFVHFMDPHTFYEAPESWRNRFQEGKAKPKAVPARFNRWQIYNLMKKQRLSDAGKAWIRNAYDAEVAYMAHELSRLLAGIEALPGDTLTVIHSDHGEEMWDHDQFEHNHTLYNELVHVELAVRPPRGWTGAPKVHDNVGLIDIAETVLDFVGVPAANRPPSDGMSLRPLIDPAQVTESTALKARLFARPMLLGHMRYGRDRWGVVYQKYKYILHSSSGNEELFDLETDPGERTNLAGRADAVSLNLMRNALGQATGWPVHRGFRIRIPREPEVTTLTFVAPIVAAAVMNPELNAEIRANLEWGERPKTLTEEVGTVALSSDRTVVTFTAGPKAFGGTLYIQCVEAVCPAGTLKRGEISTPVQGGRQSGGTGYAMESGWVLIPDDRSETRGAGAPTTATETDQLESLGYLHAESDDD